MKRPRNDKTPAEPVPDSAGADDKELGIGPPAVRCVPKPHVQGDADRFRAQMLIFLPRLHRFALSLTGNSHDCEDLVQDTCERALVSREQWQEGTRLDSWMFRIAQNLWFDRLRAKKYRGEPVDIETVPDLSDTDGRSVVESRLALAEVARGLAQLQPEHRVLIALVCVDGLTYGEAGEVLGLPLGTVMSRLARARLALHAAINREQTQNQGASRRGRRFR